MFSLNNRIYSHGQLAINMSLRKHFTAGQARKCSHFNTITRLYTQRATSFRPRFTPKRLGIGLLKVANFVFAVHLFAAYIARPSFMSGPSMLPTFSGTDEIVIEEMLTLHLFPNSLARGDIITVESPISPGRLICKRLIGLPGDIICVDPTGQFAPSTEHVIIPKGHIWISGDNAAASRDSRTYGPVPLGLVKGRVVARVWPPTEWALFCRGSGMTDVE